MSLRWRLVLAIVVVTLVSSAITGLLTGRFTEREFEQFLQVETTVEGGADYAPAARFSRRVADQVLRRGLAPGVLLNVNLPRAPAHGVRVTRQGTRRYRATAEERIDPSGRPYYWIAGLDMTPTGEADGDHLAISAGYISITPLIRWPKTLSGSIK